MRIWRSLAKPVRVALIIAAGLQVLVLLGELFYAMWSALDPETLVPFFLALHLPPLWRYRLFDAVRWLDRLWLPVAVLGQTALAGAFGAYLMWSSWRRPVVSLSGARADARELGQWLALALCCGCLSAPALVGLVSGTDLPTMLVGFGVIALTLCSCAILIAFFSAIALTGRLDEGGFLSKPVALSLWILLLATFVVPLVFRKPLSGPGPIFPLVVYFVARRAIRRRLAQTAAASENV